MKFLVYLMIQGQVVFHEGEPIQFHSMTVCLQTARAFNIHFDTTAYYCQTSRPPKGSSL